MGETWGRGCIQRASVPVPYSTVSSSPHGGNQHTAAHAGPPHLPANITRPPTAPSPPIKAPVHTLSDQITDDLSISKTLSPVPGP